VNSYPKLLSQCHKRETAPCKQSPLLPPLLMKYAFQSPSISDHSHTVNSIVYWVDHFFESYNFLAFALVCQLSLFTLQSPFCLTNMIKLFKNHSFFHVLINYYSCSLPNTLLYISIHFLMTIQLMKIMKKAMLKFQVFKI
jgi:hypothetical protein